MSDDKNIFEIILAAKNLASSSVKELKNDLGVLSSEVKKNDTVFGDLAGSVSNFKGIIAGAAAAFGITTLVAGIKSAVDTTVELGSQVSKLQRLTGMSAESASELIAVADQVGISYDTMQNAIVAVTRRMGGLKDIQDMVTDASGKSIDVFEKYGIQVKNTDGTMKDFTEVFEQIRTKIQSTSSETERLSIATQFFKGSAAELMPLLTMSAEQYKEIAADAKKYGLILTQDNVNSVKEYVMAQRDMEDAINGAKLALGKELIPMLSSAVKWITENSGALTEIASVLGTTFVSAVRIAGGTLDVLASIGLLWAAALYEIKAGLFLMTGQLSEANKAHEMAKGLMEDAAKKANQAADAFASVGEAATTSSQGVKQQNEEIKKAVLTYEEWYKQLAVGSEEYIKIKQKELQVLEAHNAYEKALLDKSLTEKKISMEEYLAAVKKLNDEEYQAKLKQIDMEIEAARKGGEKQFKELSDLLSQRTIMTEKHLTDQIKAETEAAEKIRKVKEDEFSAWKTARENEIASLKAFNDLKIAMDEEAVKAGVLRESTAMQNKLDMLKEQAQKEIYLKTDTAAKLAEITGLVTDKDRAEYEKLLSEKEQLQLKYQQTIIESESNIAETKKKEEQDAAEFIADILQDGTARAEVEYQKKLDQLVRYYQQGRISAEVYFKALDELERNHTSTFKAELKERSAQLNQWVEQVQNRIQKTQEIIDSLYTENFDDVKTYWGDYNRAMSESTDKVVWEINHLTQTLNGASYEVFWNASVFGRRMVQMVGTTVYEWMAKVRDYIAYIKGLMGSLQDQIENYRLQLMQLRGDRLGELDAWLKEEKKKLEEKYKDELSNTQEYYDALALLDELYAEKKKKLLEEMQQDEEDIASNGGAAGGTSGFKGGGNYQYEIAPPDFGDMIDTINQMPAQQQVPSEMSAALNAQVTFNMRDSEGTERWFNDELWPLFQRKFELMGVKL